MLQTPRHCCIYVFFVGWAKVQRTHADSMVTRSLKVGTLRFFPPYNSTRIRRAYPP